MRSFTKILLMTLVLAAGIPATAFAATLRVPAVYPDIAAGLAAADAGDVVQVAAGTYLEHDLILPSGVTLRGATGDPADVIIDGERAGRCVYGANLDAATRLEAVTLTGGLSAYSSTPDNSWGGGLYVDEGSLTVHNCVFLGNESAIGGGGFVRGTGAPTFTDCLFDGNSATEVAGLLLRGTCDPVVQDCTFRNGDRTLVGGGVTWGGSGTALLERCTIEDNVVIETGGGVEVIGSTANATLRYCLIRGNSAQIGAGGLYLGNGGRATLDNCTISDNSAGSYGGGVEVGSLGVLTGIQVTVLNNSAPLGPDGVVGSTAIATLTCCDVDLGLWHALGTLTLDNDDCVIATEKATWGEVKALFR